MTDNSEPKHPSDRELQEAEDNLAACLEAFDAKGEAGLTEALDQIYPESDLEGRWEEPGFYVIRRRRKKSEPS